MALAVLAVAWVAAVAEASAAPAGAVPSLGITSTPLTPHTAYARTAPAPAVEPRVPERLRVAALAEATAPATVADYIINFQPTCGQLTGGGSGMRGPPGAAAAAGSSGAFFRGLQRVLLTSLATEGLSELAGPVMGALGPVFARRAKDAPINLSDAAEEITNVVREAKRANPGSGLVRAVVGRVRAWGKFANISGAVAKRLRTKPNVLATASKFLDDGIELVFESVGDGVRILNKNGDEIGRFVDDGADGVLEIADDFFVEAGTAVPISTMVVKGNTGEAFVNAAYVKLPDGSVGFIEDVSSYGAQAVQNAIKRRGRLRSSLTGITKSQDAHHLVPVQVLKENPVAKKAVEGGFDFNNGAVNGMAIEKYVKATGVGRHGPHPKYTRQINDYLTRWANQNPGFTAQAAKQELEDIAGLIRTRITGSTQKINDLQLGLP